MLVDQCYECVSFTRVPQTLMNLILDYGIAGHKHVELDPRRESIRSQVERNWLGRACGAKTDH